MIGLVADDLTGACDSSVPFLAQGPVRVSIWPALPRRDDAAGCLAASTESRSDDPALSRQRSRVAVEHLLAMRPLMVFRKVDSRVRGNLSEDLEGALAAGFESCILAPALPAEGRITRGGVQIIGDEAIELAPLVPPGIEIRDAETDADLDAIAGELLRQPGMLAAGAAGLAAAVARALGAARHGPPGWPPVRHPLGLVGSRTEVSVEQVEIARDAGWDVRVRQKTDPVELDGHDALFLSGGATAAGVLANLGGEGLELLGEALPRLPVGRLLGGPHEGLTVCLKAGGFGGPQAIAEAFRQLVEARAPDA
ncbi:MAG TPA: four-carbon acid sugar kinase family protein [Candidatus Dormibacteraeota bacterium]